MLIAGHAVEEIDREESEHRQPVEGSSWQVRLMFGHIPVLNTGQLAPKPF